MACFMRRLHGATTCWTSWKAPNQFATRVSGAVVMYIMKLWCKYHQYHSDNSLNSFAHTSLWNQPLFVGVVSFNSINFFIISKLNNALESREKLSDIHGSFPWYHSDFDGAQRSIFSCEILSRWMYSTGLGLRRSPNIVFLLTRLNDRQELVRQQGCALA